MRPMRLPEAGGASEFSLLAEFIGLSIVSGIVGHIASKYYDRLANAILRILKRYTKKKGWAPEMWLSVSYDDVDIDVGALTPEVARELPRTMELIQSHLERAPLNSGEVTRILVGMIREESQWRERSLADGHEVEPRFWGISLEGHGQITHVYDTTTGLLAERPPEYVERLESGDLP